MTHFRQFTRSQLPAYQYAYGNKTASGVCLQNIFDYSPFGAALDGRTMQLSPYRYGFNTQEKVDEISGNGNHFTAMFWEYDTRLGRRWNTDPVVKQHESPFAILANNPISYIDPNGADTINLMKNNNGKWVSTKKQIVKGNDVFRVKVGKETKTYIFSNGEYGERINYLRLESKEKETFGFYHLSGTSKTGYGLEPEGPSTYASGTNKRIPAGTYNLDYGAGGDNWPGYPLIYNDKLSKGRGVKIHYGTSRAWSEACIVVSSDYEINAKTGKVVFNLNQAQNASWELNQHLGATSRDVNHKTSKGKSRHKLFYKDPSKLRSTNLIIKE